MGILDNQRKNFDEMRKSEAKRQEFNDKMIDLTWRYQKKYGFEIKKNDPGHDFWDNEADAFKHTFGSALMEFDMGSLGSLAGGIHHEFKTRKNPYDEWKMDSWNNNQGRKIAKEIKKEYGEYDFRALPDKKQEDIIAKKVMEKMKKGDLITHPDDKRNFFGAPEWGGYAIGKIKDIIDEVNKTKPKSSSVYSDKSLVNFKGISIDGKNWDELSNKDKEAFFEGFDSGKISNNKDNSSWTKKFNTGNPDTDDGHWVTMPNGKHLFIKDS